MNMNKFGLLALIGLSLAACKKDEEEAPAPTPTPTPTTTNVNFSVAFMNGSSAFDPAVPFIIPGGQNVRITKLKFYLHDIHLMDDEGGSAAEFHDRILLVDALASSNTFALGTMSPGHVHNVEFNLGLDSISSYGFSDQTTAPVPLNDGDMTWAWNTAAGRMFVKLEGFVDANGNNAEDAGEAFQFHGIGPDMVPVADAMLIHGDAVAGGTVTLDAKLDVALLFSTLTLPGINHNDDAQVQQLMQNLAVALQPM